VAPFCTPQPFWLLHAGPHTHAVMADDGEKKKKDRPEVPLTRDTVIKRNNARQDVHKDSPLITLQEIFEETDDKNRFIGDTMFWKYFEDIDTDRVKDTKSVEYLNLRFMLFETLFYCLLLGVFTSYAFAMQTTSVYYARQDQLSYWGGCNAETGDCNIKQVKDMASFWGWMSDELIPRAFTEYNPEAPRVANISTVFPNNDFPMTWSPRFTGPNRANLLLGSIRLKQLRVKRNTGCEVSRLYQHVFPDCFGRYSQSDQSDENYRPRFVPTYLKGAFEYTEADGEDGTQQIGIDGAMGSYPGGGFIIDLPVNKTESLSMIKDLHTWYWVDRSTRAIMVELNTMNTNINVIVNNRILFEFGATGSVLPLHDCQAAQVLFFAASSKPGPAGQVFMLLIMSLMVFGFQTLWCFYLMYKTCMNFLGGAHSLGRAAQHSLYLLKKKPVSTTIQGLKLFFKTFYHFLRYEWNMMDFMILTLWYVHVGFRFGTYGLKAMSPSLAPENIGHPEKFMPFSLVMVPLISGLQVVSVLAILVWVKSFKYLCMLSSFRLLVRILEKCAKELIVFAVVLIFVFFGFAVCFFVAYGSTDNNYSTISGSFLVLFFLLMDGYTVDPWWFAPGKLQLMPVVFFFYIALVYFVLLNVFLAIVLDTYAFTNHLFVAQAARIEGKPNPMVVFVKTYIAWRKGISLVRNEHEENMRSEDLQIDLELLPGLVRRKWIEKKRKMQRVADEAFAGLCLFPEDEGLLFQQGAAAGSDWMLPNTRMDMTKMINAKPQEPIPMYEIPRGMLFDEQKQKPKIITRSQLQRLMDEDNSLPLLLNERKAVKVIHRFRKQAHQLAPDEEDSEPESVSVEGVFHNPFMHTQADVFHRIDELERVPPEIELPKIPQIVEMTEDMSHALCEVQNQFRVQLTGIIEATATLFEHLVELTQGIDAVRNNHEEVLTLVRENLAEQEYSGSAVTGSQR